jgi:predicted RNase H-like nuclease (RuvC/YqgF family)
MMERFIKVMCKEEENIVAGMFIDQIFKTIIIKSSNTFRIKHDFLSKKLRECSVKMKEFKLDCKQKIEYSNEELKIERGFIEKETTKMRNLIASQKAQIEKLQSVIDDKKHEIKELTSKEDRELNVRDLQEKFNGLKDMINDHESFHGR